MSIGIYLYAEHEKCDVNIYAFNMGPIFASGVLKSSDVKRKDFFNLFGIPRGFSVLLSAPVKKVI